MLQIKGGFWVTYIVFISELVFSLKSPTVKPAVDLLEKVKSENKSDELHLRDDSPPITLDKIKKKLKDVGIFDWQNPDINDTERKELNKLLDTVEIMTSSRTRQPTNVQNIFASLRLVERVIKKQLEEGRISESLASKFDWNKISKTQRLFYTTS